MSGKIDRNFVSKEKPEAYRMEIKSNVYQRWQEEKNILLSSFLACYCVYHI